MAWHRKIDVRMWGDQRFRELVAPPPCSQFAWIFLLTCRFTTSLPGLLVAGEAAIAEALHWPIEGFRKAFSEISAKGMATADWAAPLVFVRNAVNYNFPESPNVVRSWANHWDMIPECALKLDAYRVLTRRLEAKGKAFAEAFSEACRRPCLQASPNQEQEQDQEQEHEQEQELGTQAADAAAATTPVLFGDNGHSKPAMAGSSKPQRRRRAQEADPPGFANFWGAYPRREDRHRAVRAWRKLNPDDSTQAKILAGVEHWQQAGRFVDLKFVPLPATWLNNRRWEDQFSAHTGGTHANRQPRPGLVFDSATEQAG
jgi:hypothetical protein